MNEVTKVDRADRGALYLSVGIVALAIVAVMATALSRVLEVLTSDSVPVTVGVDGAAAELFPGADLGDLDVAVESATVYLDHPTGKTIVALYAQPLWFALTLSAVLVITGVLLVRLARGRFFDGGASKLVFAAALIVGFGWLGEMALSAAVNAGVYAFLAGRAGVEWVFEFTLTPLLVCLLLGALTSAVQVGERLHRDNAGLV